MRFLSIFVICVISQASLASNSVIGDWCKKYDDFTEAYKIELSSEGEMTVRQFTIGNSSGEVHGNYEGFLSIGASSVVMQLNGVDQELSDITTSYSFLRGQSRLRLNYRNGDTLLLNKCSIRFSQQ